MGRRQSLHRLTPLASVLLASCAGGPGATGHAQPGFPDPLGAYDVVLSSGHMVSEGTLEITGKPGFYSGRLSVGGFVGAVRSVETGLGHMLVEVEAPGGVVVLRLATDGQFFSGNWVMGEQRGTATADKRRPHPDKHRPHPGVRYEDIPLRPVFAGPLSTGRSLRSPHSDHEPS